MKHFVRKEHTKPIPPEKQCLPPPPFYRKRPTYGLTHIFKRKFWSPFYVFFKNLKPIEVHTMDIIFNLPNIHINFWRTYCFNLSYIYILFAILTRFLFFVKTFKGLLSCSWSNSLIRFSEYFTDLLLKHWHRSCT